MIPMRLGFSWIFIMCFSLVKSATPQPFIETIDDLNTTIVAVDRSLRLKVKWIAHLRNGTKLDILIKDCTGGENCKETPCSEYGVSKELEEHTFPRYIGPVVVEHSHCVIEPGCVYFVKVATANSRVQKNVTVTVPDCFQNVCSCKFRTDLPKPNISSEMLTSNSLNISWNFPQMGKNLFKKNTTLDIFISVSQGHNPTLPWGGRQTLIDSHSYPINFTTYNNSTTNKYHIKFNMPTKLVQGSIYFIRAHTVDEKGCTSREYIHKMTIPAIKNESRQSSDSYESIFTLIIPIAITVLVVLFLSNYLYRSMCKTNSATNWRNIYRNTPSSGLHQISMEDNLLYLDKDILEAQENGKADIFEVPHNYVLIGEEIGKGAFGRVYKATAQNLLRLPGTRTVAVKQLKKRPTTDEVEEFIGEIQTMKDVGRHENIVALFGCCTIKEPLMMIMEYIGHGDLLKYLRNIRKKHLELFRIPRSSNSDTPTNPSVNVQLPQGKYLELKHSTSSMSSYASYIKQPDTTPANLRPSVTETMYTILSQNSNGSELNQPELDYILDSKELHNFALQIAKGMHHLEEKGITHRDLAARNILIDSRKTLKISDFGLSRAGIYVNTKTKKLPLRWLSIEAIRDNLYSSSSDVWAFAIVLWEIGTLGGFPYPTINNHEILEFLSQGSRLERPEVCSELLYKLMLQCWQEDPENRPTFAEILKLLQPQNQKIYVDFNSLGPDYVFPPTQEQVLESSSSNTSVLRS